MLQRSMVGNASEPNPLSWRTGERRSILPELTTTYLSLHADMNMTCMLVFWLKLFPAMSFPRSNGFGENLVIKGPKSVPSSLSKSWGDLFHRKQNVWFLMRGMEVIQRSPSYETPCYNTIQNQALGLTLQYKYIPNERISHLCDYLSLAKEMVAYEWYHCTTG